MVSTRLPGLDALRALAITWVLLFHARTLRLGQPLGVVGEVGWMGVDLFFALSGYLIATQWFASFEAPGALRAFYVRRAFRILPAYAVTLAVYLFAPSLREAPNLMPTWQYVTFTENLFMTFDVPRAFTHVWSLCVEEHFYLLFPLLSLGVARWRPRLGAWLVVALVVFGFAVRAWVWFTRVVPAVEPDVAYFEQLYYPTYTRLDGLLAGVAVAMTRRWRPAWFEALRRAGWKLVVFAVVALVTAARLFDDGPNAWAVIVGFTLIAVGMAALVTSATQWRMEVPLAAPLATGAFSLYLSHKLAFAFVRERWGVELAQHDGVAALSYGAAAVVVGAALYFAVERPFLSLRR